MSYQASKTFIRKWEGGAYRPKPGAFDPNPTHLGMRQDTFDRYCRSKDEPCRSVYDIQEHEWDDLFKSIFWDAVHGDILPEPLDIVMADTAFHSGPKQAIKFLQRALGVQADGIFGPITKKALQQADLRHTVIRVIGQRIRFLQRLYERTASDDDPKNDAPIRGWMNRMRDLERVARAKL